MDDQNEKPKKEIKVHKIFGTIPLEDQVQSPMVKVMKVVSKIIDGPTSWFHENIVLKYRADPQPYYHRKFRRVPTIDQCYTDDLACVYEANEQFKRDRKVDTEIRKILKQRYYRCSYFERTVNEWDYDLDTICQKEKNDLLQAEMNLFIKYGEMGQFATVIDAYMKQKHRLIWERRQKANEQKS